MNELLLGARLSLRGSRARVAVTGLALAFAVAFLLAVLGALPARQAKLDRLAARLPVSYGSIAAPDRQPHEPGPLVSQFFSTWRGHTVGGFYVVRGGSPVAPGLPRWPRAGEAFVSPALASALRGPHRAELVPRVPGRVVGEIGTAGLSGPSEMLVYAGVSRVSPPYPPQEVARFGYRQNRADVPRELRVAAQLGAVGLLLPVLVLVATATRLSAAARDRRLAAVRLVGGTPRQVALLAAGEALVVGALGSLAGLLVFRLLRPVAASLVPVDGGVFASDLAPPTGQLVGVLLLVPLLSAAVALLAMRRLVVDPLGVRRRGRRRSRAGWWRAAPLALGLLALGVMWQRHKDFVGVDVALLLGGGGLTVVGLAVIAPAVSRLAGTVLVRVPGTAGRLAGRRLQADPSATARTLTGTVLVVFVGTWLLAFLPILKVTQSTEATRLRAYLPGPTISVGLGAALSGTADRALRAVPGVRHAVTIGTASVARPGVDFDHPGQVPEDGPTQVAVARCSDLAALLGRPLPCGRARAFVPAHADADAVYTRPRPGRVSVLGGDGRALGQVQLPAPVAVDLGPDPYGLLDAAYVVDPSVLPVARGHGGAAFGSRLLVTTDGHPGTTEQVRNVLSAYGVYGASTLDEQLAQEQRVVRGYERAARLGLVLAVLVGSIGLLIASADAVHGRRRDLATLAALGVPVRVLRRALMLEVVAPLLGCTVVALASGAFASAAYLAGDTYYRDQVGLPWSAWGGVAGTAVIAVLALTALTLPLARAAVRPEGLRTE